MNLNHLHLRVRSRDASQRFYETFFGLAEQARHGDIVFLGDRAGMDLALAPAEEVEAFPTWFHFGFRLPSPGEVERLHARLSEAGAPIREPLTREDELVYFRCADPDGYGVEVYWEPRPERRGA